MIMFETIYIIEGKFIACQIIVAGFFYAFSIQYSGSEPPCVRIMQTLPSRCRSTGWLSRFLISAYNSKLCKMIYTEIRSTQLVQQCQALLRAYLRQPSGYLAAQIVKSYTVLFNYLWLYPHSISVDLFNCFYHQTRAFYTYLQQQMELNNALNQEGVNHE